MAVTSQYASTAAAAAVTVSTVNTALNGSGSFDTVVAAATNGTRIDDISIQATGTVSSANMLRLFLYNGNNNILWKEIPISVGTSSQSSATTSIQLTNLALVIPNTWVLKACVHATLSVNVLITRMGHF